MRFELMDDFHRHGLANRSFNHSGNPPCEANFSKITPNFTASGFNTKLIPMPKFFKRHLLVPKTPQLEINSPLDTPELPSGIEDTQHQLPPADSPPMPNPEVDQNLHQENEFIRNLLVWRAPARPYRKRDRSFFVNASVVAVLVILIALLVQDILLVGAILALTFLAFVLYTIEPEEIDYHLSTQGITIGNHFYLWNDLESFWISQKDHEKIIYIRTYYRFPAVIMLVAGDTPVESIKQVCARYLPFHEIPPKTMMDDLSNWLQKHFPLENPKR